MSLVVNWPSRQGIDFLFYLEWFRSTITLRQLTHPRIGKRMVSVLLLQMRTTLRAIGNSTSMVKHRIAARALPRQVGMPEVDSAWILSTWLYLIGPLK